MTLLIVAALPDPLGADRGHETITLLNTGPNPVELTGWALADGAGGRQRLSGTIAGGAVQQVGVGAAMPLGNRGDTIVLHDPNGHPIDQVAYKNEKVRPGRTICFGR